MKNMIKLDKIVLSLLLVVCGNSVFSMDRLTIDTKPSSFEVGQDDSPRSTVVTFSPHISTMYKVSVVIAQDLAIAESQDSSFEVVDGVSYKDGLDFYMQTTQQNDSGQAVMLTPKVVANPGLSYRTPRAPRYDYTQNGAVLRPRSILKKDGTSDCSGYTTGLITSQLRAFTAVNSQNNAKVGRQAMQQTNSSMNICTLLAACFGIK